MAAQWGRIAERPGSMRSGVPFITSRKFRAKGSLVRHTYRSVTIPGRWSLKHAYFDGATGCDFSATKNVVVSVSNRIQELGFCIEGGSIEYPGSAPC